ncbi:MAG: peptidylprolyl isomerase, partial [Firmicutes bacterium]|nr:peptidylprolyl isomerase [Bacillota bacterium]
MKKTLLIFFAIVLLVALSACGATDEKGAVIGSVNGVDVYQSEYEHYLADYFDSYYSYYGDNYGLNLADQEIIDTYMPTFMSDLEYYSWQHCVEAALIRQVANDEFGITYDNEFAKAFLPYGEYRTVETDGILSQLTTSDAVQNAASAAAEAAFNADPKEYRGTSHILITCDVEDAEAKAAAYEQACQVIQMLQDGASFEDMIAAYSAESTTSYDPNDAEGNMIDGSTRFVQEYADGAFSLAKEGDYTLEPVLTQYGYHIIRL